METILLTGSSGFIGSHLKNELSNNYNLICIDKKENFNLCHMKLEDFCDYLKILQLNKIDYIVHLAALTGVRSSLKQEDVYYNNNIKSFSKIIEFADYFRPKKILFASSSSIYGRNTKQTEEGFNFDPLSPYAITKVTNEFQANLARKRHKLISMRFFTVYGPNGRKDMSPYIFMDKIFKNQKIEIFGQGLFRDFTYVEDIIKGIKLIIEKGKGDAYNMGKSCSDKLEDLVNYISFNMNKKANLSYINRNYFEPIKTECDSSLFQKEFNYKFDTSLETGIKKTCDWYLKNSL